MAGDSNGPLVDGEPLDHADRQAIVLALAILALDRPGWIEYLKRIAARFGPNGDALFEEFHRFNADRWRTAPGAPVTPPAPLEGDPPSSDRRSVPRLL